jgi:hypothetical protein
MENQNTKEAMEKNKIKIMETLRSLQGAPSVQMQEVSRSEEKCLGWY